MPWARHSSGSFLYNITPAKNQCLFKCVTQSGNEEEGGPCKHWYMNQRPVGVVGEGYTHLNQDKLVYIIYCLFIIEYISLLNYLLSSPILPISLVSMHNTERFYFHIHFFPKILLLALNLYFLLPSQGIFFFIIQ